jgi:hypothetical protein
MVYLMEGIAMGAAHEAVADKSDAKLFFHRRIDIKRNKVTTLLQVQTG